ncbi:MAG: tRNA guanosine(34) transglycosylase Tgt [Verrucomicrobia bacterium CG_4_10_14_3_um_filter_43_23]|nr:MAG: tRNA guanosine(34) transglycosylase Tgt [Verrucomicrobia bacterium CG1_02_43_26]PIP60109.1 MAG: tRNA guanosine(34) transglycosylase Tgt [Verrucomicrobia bacterium CG22_combo_CG10-13_8_21_14_all_43_17]PIX57910.1 MAG: tRNA guanosine(34) transglycosylase Tgt [Verrucomicrobia bacterium CG_4_10_14_3_um_filter_43_23]PIY61133.1 MAG: tRNA guanosine(34) transglycosylase Tgt [Verrucomicrobia bacterium CG_4_10_14_0_8_um_filter_43_34]PJA43478.1 MAG: tRNA guanosine(34) transglycosylase Tgt [Verrucom
MPEYSNFKFEIQNRDSESKARYGVLKTPHGDLETPNFIFCATKGAMKSVTTEHLRAAGADIILSNTYHMFVQPGPDLVAKHGGLHKFLNWDKPMLTDSGGFQIFSLGHGGVASEIKGNRQLTSQKMLKKIDEDGAIFRSYVDGTMHRLTPELSIDIQRKLGADIILVLDECTPFHSDRRYTERSMQRSHRWEKRSLEEFIRGDNGAQCLYGIVQGGIYPDLRKESASFVASEDFFGQAIGGSLGGGKEQMFDVVSFTTPYLHPDRPIHLLGIGGIRDIWNGVEQGIDTFDCVHPTRLARHGGALVHPAMGEGKEHINIKNARFKEDLGPIEAGCDCYCCQNFTRAYVHYLFQAKELIGGTLLTIHNIRFMCRLAKTIREAIRNGEFQAVKKTWM